MDIAKSRFLDVPNFGHYDTWRIDLLQLLVEQNTGKMLYPGWQNVCDFRDTKESFVTVPLHTEDLQNELNDKVKLLQEQSDGKYCPKLSSDMRFLCDAWGVPLPFLPVIRPKELKVFSKIMLDELRNGFDSDRMSHLWIKYVDGYDIFPKLPSQLRDYYRSWERNDRIKRAAAKMRADQDLLQEFLDRTKPSELEEQIESGMLEEEEEELGLSQGTLTMPQAQMPVPLPQVLPLDMRLPLEAPRLVVGNVPMAITGPVEVNPPQGAIKRKHGERGNDRVVRSLRRCVTCLQLQKIEDATLCPGKTQRRFCINMRLFVNNS
jgi:hypothetical protein